MTCITGGLHLSKSFNSIKLIGSSCQSLFAIWPPSHFLVLSSLALQVGRGNIEATSFCYQCHGVKRSERQKKPCLVCLRCDLAIVQASHLGEAPKYWQNQQNCHKHTPKTQFIAQSEENKDDADACRVQALQTWSSELMREALSLTMASAEALLSFSACLLSSSCFCSACAFSLSLSICIQWETSSESHYFSWQPSWMC